MVVASAFRQSFTYASRALILASAATSLGALASCGAEIPYRESAMAGDIAGREGKYKEAYEAYLEGFESKGFKGSWEDVKNTEKSALDHHAAAIAAAKKEADRGNYQIAFMMLQALAGRMPETEAQACEQTLITTRAAMAKGDLAVANRTLFDVQYNRIYGWETRGADLKRMDLKKVCPPYWRDQQTELGKAFITAARAKIVEKKHEEARLLLMAVIEPDHFWKPEADEARALLGDNAGPLLAAAPPPVGGSSSEWSKIVRIEEICEPLSPEAKASKCAPIVASAIAWHLDRASKAPSGADGAILFHLRMAERMGDTSRSSELSRAYAAMDQVPGSTFVLTRSTPKCAGIDTVLQSSLAPIKGPVTVSLDISDLKCAHDSNTWTTGGEQTESYETEMRLVEETHQEEKWVRDSSTEFICTNQTVTGCKDIRPKPITETITVTEKVEKPVRVRKITTAPSEVHRGNSTSVSGPVVVRWTDDEPRVGTQKVAERTIIVNGRVKTEGGTSEQHYAAALVRPMALLRLRIAEAMILERAAHALKEDRKLDAEHGYAKLAKVGAISGQKLPPEPATYFSRTYGIPAEELQLFLKAEKLPPPNRQRKLEEVRQEQRREERKVDPKKLLRDIDELNRRKREGN